MGVVEPYSRLALIYDELVVDPAYPSWARFLHDLWSCDAAPVVAVLDVCCGTGLLARELVGRGYRVTGVDQSPEMLARARALLGESADLRESTLPELGVHGVYDAAISTFDGLNYLSPAALRGSIAAIGERLRAGGWFVFDLHADAMMWFTAENPIVSGDEDGRSFRIESRVSTEHRRCESRITVRGGGLDFSEIHTQYFHDESSVRAALGTAGFTDAVAFDEYTHAPASARTMRTTWVARRP